MGAVVADTGCSDGLGSMGIMLVGRVGMLCSVLHGVTVRTGLLSMLAREGLWEGIGT